MWKNIGTGGLARGKILGRLAFYTWVDLGSRSMKKVYEGEKNSFPDYE